MIFLWIFLILTPCVYSARTPSLPINICPEEEAEETFRIYNGENVELLEHPWLALIKININGENIQCGGSLISSEYVLTAAHCFSHLPNFASSNEFFDPPEVKIILGEHNTKTNPDIDSYDELLQTTYAESNVSYIAIPMSFDKKSTRVDFSYDVALVRLKTKISISRDHIKPICLPDENVLETVLEGKRLTAVGFGRTESEQLSTIKKQAGLTVISETECQEMFDKNTVKSGRIPTIKGENQICAKDKTADTCNGDSGGPLILNNRFLMGIISVGANECGDPKFPAVFSRVTSELIEWIKMAIQNYDEAE